MLALGVKKENESAGFTLIEMSIVLVIIGLIVGGVLVGQDLIRAAYIRAQISQIEKFNTAVNTFYGKYQALPGDMGASTVATYGFSTATHNAANPAPSGRGDGNGIIDGNVGGLETTTVGNLAGTTSMVTPGGETGVFWVDLSSPVAGNLIEGGFAAATEATQPNVSNTQLPQYLPVAKLGGGNYVYVVEINGFNYFGIANVLDFNSEDGTIENTAGMTVSQAYNIDKKIDDGFPTTGNVVTMLTYDNGVGWAMGGWFGVGDTYISSGSVFGGVVATPGNASGPTTCFDAATIGSDPTYSMEQNGGAGLNCALMIRMQGGD
jgi:prepilin-type N-terminal cleavage/methylation domain-containing protein